MTMKELAERVAALEAEVRELRAAAGKPATGSWADAFGEFADDPSFPDVVRFGREWREQVNRESLEEFDRQQAREVDRTSAAEWLANSGRFRDDPMFDEIVRLGREYRESH